MPKLIRRAVKKGRGAALIAALRTSHESMPNVIIKGSDLSDIIAYVLSLQKTR